MDSARQREAGMALLVVLMILLLVAGSSVSFIWFMNQQQTRSGARYRSTAAMSVAEAGVHRVLSILESVAPDGRSGREWRPAAHSEAVPVGPTQGRFTVSLTDEADGAILVTSVGEVHGTARRLRARVYLASPALLAALHGTSFVRLEKPPAAIFILPYGAGIGDRPWIHIAAGQAIWFATADVSINDPSRSFHAGPGPIDAPMGANDATTSPRPGPVNLLLTRGAPLLLGRNHDRVEVQQLRAWGVYIQGVIFRAEELHRLPEIDQAYFQAQAASNTTNAALNEAAGKYFGDRALARKRDSLYAAGEFEQLQAYLETGLRPPRFQGVIYIRGGFSLAEGRQLQIAEGALIAENTVHLSQGASLEVTHSAATRRLPGIIVLDDGLVVTQGARLRVHGLVYANRVIGIGEGAHADIVGTVLGNDRRLSFRNVAATVVIRYDPAVLGTPGLRVPRDAPVVAWVAAWEELP